MCSYSLRTGNKPEEDEGWEMGNGKCEVGVEVGVGVGVLQRHSPEMREMRKLSAGFLLILSRF